MSNDSIRITVHSGAYHTDDVFAMAIASQWAHKRGYDATMTRTRDQAVIDDSQIVLDVGGVFDPGRHRYDHHQPGYDHVRDNGIPYASAGLAWQAYGMELCDNSSDVHRRVDEWLIQPIDAIDAGINLVTSTHPSGVYPFDLASLTAISQPTWRERQTEPGLMNQGFWNLHDAAKKILNRTIIHVAHGIEAEQCVITAYNNAVDKRIVVCDMMVDDAHWMNLLCKYPEPLFFVYRRAEGGWGAKTVRTNGLMDFQSRSMFPSQWAGLDRDELRAVTGVSDATFAHRARFLVGAESLAGVMALVHRALDQLDAA